MADLAISVELEGMTQVLASLQQMEKSLGSLGSDTRGLENLNRGFDSVITRTEAFGRSIETLGFHLSIGLSAPLAMLGKSVLDAGAEWERMTRQMTVATGSSEAAARELEFVRAVADQLGVGLADSGTQFAKFAISATQGGASMDTVRAAFIAVSEASSVLGMSSQETGRVFNAMSQMFSKGAVSMEELRQQLGERLAGALDLAAKATGLTQAEFVKLVATGQLATTNFFPAFIAQIHAAFGPAAQGMAEGFFQSMNRMNNALLMLRVSLANAGLMDAVANLANAVTVLANAAVELDPSVKRAALALGAFLAILGPLATYVGLVVMSFGALGAAGAALVTGLAALIAVVAAFGPEIRSSVVTALGEAQAAFQAWDGTAQDLGRILGEITGQVITWGVEFVQGVAGSAMEAGAGLITEVSSWDIGAALSSVLNGVAEFGSAFLEGIVATAGEAGQGLIAEVSAWDIRAGLDALLQAVAEWGGPFLEGIVATAMEAGQGLVDSVSTWDIRAGLDALLAAIAEWGSSFYDAVLATVMESGMALIDAITSWDLSGALMNLLPTLSDFGVLFRDAVVTTFYEVGQELASTIMDWSPDLAGAMGYLAGVLVGSVFELQQYLVTEFINLGVELYNEFSSGLAGHDWESAFYQIVTWAYEGLLELRTVGYEVVLEFGQQFLEGLSDALGVDVINYISSFAGDLYAALTIAFGDAYDGVMSIVTTLGDQAADFIGQIPAKIAAFGVTIFDSMVKPFDDAYRYLVGQSVVPETVDRIGQIMGTLPSVMIPPTQAATGGVTSEFDKMQASLTRLATQAVSSILRSTEGFQSQAAALRELEAHYISLGAKGEAGLQQVAQGMERLATTVANARIREIMADWSLSFDQQAAKLKELGASLEQELGGRAAQAVAKVTAELQKLRADQAMEELDRQIQGLNLSLQSEVGYIQAAITHWRGFGTEGAQAVKELQDRLVEVQQELANSRSWFLGIQEGVQSAISDFTDFRNIAGDATRQLFTDLQGGIREFIMTGKLELGSLKDYFLGVFADIASQVITGYIARIAESFVGIPQQAQIAGGQTATYLTQAFGTSATAATAEVQRIMAGMGLLPPAAQQASTGVTAGFSTMWTNVRNGFTTLWTSVQSGFTSLATGIATVWNAIGSGALTAVNGIRTTFAGLGPALTSVWTSIQSGASTMFAALSGLVTGWVNTARTLFAGLPPLLTGVWQSIQSGAQVMFAGLSSAVTAWVNTARTLFAGLPPLLSGVWTQIQAGAQTMFAGLSTSVSTWVNTARTLFAGLPPLLAGVWTQIQAGAAAMFAGLSSGVTTWVNTARTLFAGLPPLLAGVWAQIQAGATAMFGSLSASTSTWVNTARTLFAGLPPLLSSVWASIQASAQSMFAALNAATTTWINAARTLFASLTPAVQAVWSAIQSSAQAMFAAVTGATTSFAATTRTLFQSIQPVAQAVWSAIQASAQAMYGALTAATNTFSATAKSLFQSIQPVVQSVWSAIQASAQAMYGALTAATNAFSATAKSLFQSIQPVVQAVWSSIQSGATAMFSAITSLANNWMNTARSIFSTVQSIGQSTFSAILSGGQSLFSGLSSAMSSFGSLASSMWNSFSSIARSNLQSTGGSWSSLVGAVASGASSMAGSAGNAVGSVISGIRNIGSAIAGFFSSGGFVEGHRFAVGGQVQNTMVGLGGPQGTDVVPAWLTPGEFVINAAATAQFLPLLEAINSGRLNAAATPIWPPGGGGGGGGTPPGGGGNWGGLGGLGAGFFEQEARRQAGTILGGVLAANIAPIGPVVTAVDQVRATVAAWTPSAVGSFAARGYNPFDPSQLGTLRSRTMAEAMTYEELSRRMGQVGISGMPELNRARQAQDIVESMESFASAARVGMNFATMVAGSMFGPAGAFVARAATPAIVDLAARAGAHWETNIKPTINEWLTSNSVLSSIADLAAGAWNAITGALSSIGGAIMSGIRSAWSAVRDAVGGLFGGGTTGGGGGDSAVDGRGQPGGGALGPGGGWAGPGGSVHTGGLIRNDGLYKLLDGEAVISARMARDILPLLETVNSKVGRAVAGFSSANMKVGAGEYLRTLGRGDFVLNPEATKQMGFRRAATGADALVSRPTLFLAGEGGSPERVKITPAGRRDREGGGTTLVFQAPIIASDMTMNQFTRRLQRDILRSRDPRSRG